MKTKALIDHARRVAALVLAAAAETAAAQGLAAADELVRFGSWLSGEWSNNEQVWQHDIDVKAASAPNATAPVYRVHRVIRAAGPAAGGGLLFSVQPAVPATASTAAPAAAAAPLQWLRLRSGATPGEVSQEVLTTPTAAASGSPGCAVTWRYNATDQAYTATTAAGPCSAETLLTRGPVLRLGLRSLSADGAISRKLRYFEAWVWIKQAGPGATADDKRASFTRRVLFHSEGERAVVRYEDGSESPYALELAQLTYQNTRKSILKLGLIERATGKTLTYTWANPEATMIGMNLGWFQAGLTQKAERPDFAD